MIHVLHHSLSIHLKVDPRFYEGDWHVKVAKQIVKRSSKYLVECWRPERTFKNVYMRKGSDGIVYKIFPSTSIGSNEFSFSLSQHLREEVKKGDVIIHLHSLYTLTTYISALLVKQVNKKTPVVAQSHWGVPRYFLLSKGSYLKRFLRLFRFGVEHLVFNNVDVFFVLSLEEYGFFSSRGKFVEMSPMGVDFEKFRPISKEVARRSLGLEESRPYLIYVGRLAKEKGPHYLLSAFRYVEKKMPDVRLIFVGDGPLRPLLESTAKNMGIYDKVLFMGWKHEDELPMYYNAADVVVFPFLHEGLGMAPLEALACRKPLVATSNHPVAATPQLVRELGDVIYTAPRGDPQSLASRILEVLPKADELSKKIPREKLEKYYSWDTIIKRTLDIYQQLTQNTYST